jgi:4,5-DOPA dioxygenase extradiol
VTVASDVMPALFVGHGSPMNTIETNRWTRAWAELAGRLPRPRAILAISAHWYINATAVTAMEAPATIHDFFGFPAELFAFRYPAPGSPELADRVVDVVDPIWVGRDLDSWGLDHGTWSVLAHLFPAADVPVVQLSIDASKQPGYHVDLGRALAPLRAEGVMVVASGNVVHNLAMVDPARPEGGFDWAIDYDTAATAIMSRRPGAITELGDHPAHHLAAPTPDHLLPLYYLAGLSDAAGTGTEVAVEGYALGSLSMTTHLLI